MRKNKESKVKEKKVKTAAKESEPNDAIKGILIFPPKTEYVDLPSQTTFFTSNSKLRLNIYKDGDPIQIPLAKDGSDLPEDATPLDNSEDLDVRYERYRETPCYVVNVTMKNPVSQQYVKLNGDLGSGSIWDIDDILPTIAKTYGKNIYRINIGFELDDILLKILNEHFLHCTQIFSRGFTENAVKFLHSNRKNFTKRVTKLGFINFLVYSKLNCLTPFKNLQQLTIEQRNYSQIEHTQALLEHLREFRKIETISLRFFYEPLFYWQFASHCKKFKFSEGFTFSDKNLPEEIRVQKLLKLMPLTNLSKLEIRFDTFEYIHAIQFFSSLNIYNLETVYLSHIEFDDKMLEHFHRLQETPESKLKNLSLRYWMGKGHITLPLTTLCSKSIVKLSVCYCDVGSNDFLYVLKNCPNLEDFECDPPANQPSPRNVNIFHKHSRLLLHFLTHAIVALEKFKSFKTSLTLKPDILILLCNPVKILKQARFVVHGINPVATKEMLERFYDTVVVYGDFCRKEPRKEQNNNDFVDTCGFWKIFLDNPKASPPREKIDFSPIYCDIQKCLCKVPN